MSRLDRNCQQTIQEMTVMSRKVVIITGANQGIGYETALGLAKRKLRIIMADKADQTKSRQNIIIETGNEEIIAEHLDLASFKSVRNFAERINHTNDRLDVLINNAGVFCRNKWKTIDGINAMMQTNYLAPFLLTNTLQDLLKRTTGSRIIFVSSSGSFFHQLQLKDLKDPEDPKYFNSHFISSVIQYYNTKLCTMIAAKGFSEKFYPWNIISNSIHPGMTNTDFLIANYQEYTLKTRIAERALKYFTQDKKKSADLLIFMATSETIECVSGKYFVDYRIHREPAILENKYFCHNIWLESEKLVGLVP